MSDDLVKRLRGAYKETDPEGETYTVRYNPDGPEAADRIEELEAEIKLLSEGVTIAHLRGAMDAHANRADDIWAKFKDRWDGERKYALRKIVKYLRGDG